MTIITAPPGYGKSILVREYARQAQEERILLVNGPDLLAARTADGADDELLAAFRNLAWCIAHEPDCVAPATAALLDSIRAFDARSMVIVDDFDELDPVVAETLLAQMLDREYRPTNVRMILVTRLPVRLPSRFRGRHHDIQQLTRDDLAFTREELAEVLDGYFADRETLDRLLQETRGWPFGVQIALAQQDDPIAAARQWQVLDGRVRDAILARLQPADQDILIAAHDLPWLTSELWQDLATTVQQPVSSFSTLVANLPMITTGDTLSDPPVSMIVPHVRAALSRYAVVAENPALRDAVLAIASPWLVRHGYVREAGALMRTPDQWERFFRHVEPILRERAIRDDHVAVITALADVPREALVRSDDLAFWNTMSLLSTGEIAEGIALSACITAQWHEAMTPLRAGRSAFLRALAHIRLGNRESALAEALAALEVLPGDAWHERFRAAATAEVLSTHIGEMQRASAMFALARHYREQLPWDQRWWLAFVLPNQADRVALSGDLPAAEAHFEHLLASSTRAIPEQVGLLLMRMALIALERNDLVRARSLVDAIPRPLASTYWMHEVALTEAKVLHAEGRDDEARAVLYAVIRDASSDVNEIEVRRAKVMLAQIWVDDGSVALATAWDDEESLSMDAWPRSFGNLVPAMVKAQLRIVQRQWDAAHALLDDLIAEGTRRQQLAPLVRCHALKAFAYARCGETALSHQAIRAGLAIGAPSAFYRSFLVGPLDVRSLLVSEEIAELVTDEGAARRDALCVALTAREREVLVFASRGLTNGEIADRMYLSALTIKNHLARIYRKLGVRNRTDAIVVATSMGLLWARDGVESDAERS